MTSVLALVVALLAPSNTATLTIEVSPDNASIYVDGKRVQPEKGGKVSVSPGERTVRAVRSGYRSETRVIKAKAGQTYRVSLKLARSTSKAPAKKPVATAPSKRPSKRPTASPSKRPSKKPAAKRPVAKRPSKSPVKKPTAGKRPTKKPSTTKPAVGRRPSSPSPRPSARPASPQPIRDEAQPSAPSYRGYAIVSFLVGGAAIAGGVYMGTQADASADEFNRSFDRREKMELKDDTEFNATVANVLYGVGAAGVALGALLWAAEPDYRYSVSPMPGGGTYVGVEGRF